MTPEEFVDRFSDLEDISVLRGELSIDDLPTDPQHYLKLAKKLFPRHEYEDLDLRQRFVSLCNQLLYRDGRTFFALWHVVKWSLVNDEISRNGVNALTGIACYLKRSPALPIEMEELRKILVGCLRIERLKRNASVCLEIIELCYE